MPRFLPLLGLLLLWARLAAAQAPTYAWATPCATFDPNEAGGPRCVAADAQGGSVVAGSFTGTVAFGPFTLTSRGGSDVFVARLDAQGRYLWAVAAGGPAGDAAQAVAVDAQGRVYLAGSFASFSAGFGGQTLFNSGPGAEAFVAALDAQGAWQWARRAGGPDDDRATALALTPQGEVLVAGSFVSVFADFGPAQLTNTNPSRSFGDVFVARLSSTGTWLGAVGAGGTGDERTQGLVCGAQGRAYLSGTYNSTPAAFGPHTLTTGPNGSGQNSSIAVQLFVAEINLSTNTWVWAVNGGAAPGPTTGGTGNDGLACDSAGGLYVTGAFSGPTARFGALTINNRGQLNNRQQYTRDLYIAKLDAAAGGTWRWAKRFGSDTDDNASAIAANAAGEVLIAGDFASPVLSFEGSSLTSSHATSGYSFLALIETSTGTWHWTRGTAPYEAPQTSAVIAGSNSGWRLIGNFTQSVTFDAITLQNSGGGAVTGFVARLGSGPLAAVTGRVRPSFEVWPNPTRQTVWVRGPAPGQPVQLHDELARVVATGAMPVRGPLRLTLPAGLASGLYWLRATGYAAQAITVE